MISMRWAQWAVRHKSLIHGSTLVFALVYFVFAPVAGAAQSSPAISQGFKTNDANIVAGALVSFEKSAKDQVQLANSDRVSELAGIAGSTALVELGAESGEAQVVTSGITSALVSDINGTIKTGDKITASPVNGVGMKADSGTQVVGIARADLAAVKTSERQVKARDGTTVKVNFGSIPVQVNISYFAAPDDDKSFLPPFLQKMANDIAGKEVPVVRVVLAFLVLGLGFISIGVMLYASVRSSIISIGRNPLSEKAVRKSLFGVATVALAILLVMLSAIYLILTI